MCIILITQVNSDKISVSIQYILKAFILSLCRKPQKHRVQGSDQSESVESRTNSVSTEESHVKSDKTDSDDTIVSTSGEEEEEEGMVAFLKHLTCFLCRKLCLLYSGLFISRNLSNLNFLIV